MYLLVELREIIPGDNCDFREFIPNKREFIPVDNCLCLWARGGASSSPIPRDSGFLLRAIGAVERLGCELRPNSAGSGPIAEGDAGSG